MSEEMFHVPVLREDVARWLLDFGGNSGGVNGSEKVIVDATLGGGGHSEVLLERSRVQLIGIDQDEDAIRFAQQKLKKYQDRLVTVQANFSEVVRVLRELSIQKIDGILFDLGISSHQVDQKERGFSFQSDGPLDMRMNRSGALTARVIVNTFSAQDLSHLISELGEEHHSRAIARMIVRARNDASIETTGDLARIVTRTVKGPYSLRSVARVFQALRIYVNDELTSFQKSLEAVLPVLNPGSRIVVLAYHSLEDRIVKDLFRRESTDCICPPKTIPCVCGHRATLNRLTRKPVRASEEEIRENSRAASVKMRVAEKK